MRSGSCNPPFADLQSRCRDYRHYLATDNIARKKELLREQIAKNREYYAKLERQRRCCRRTSTTGAARWSGIRCFCPKP